jgi:phosphoserine aminotransferase
MKYFTVGPTQTHPRFREFMLRALDSEIPSLSHRSPAFTDMFVSLSQNIKKLFSAPADYTTVFLSSATECMERSIQNLSTRETLHFVSGNFADRAYTFAVASSRKATKVLPRSDGSFSLDDIPEDCNPELIFFTHSETSSGIQMSREFITDVCNRFPHALTAVDIVSSAPTADIPIVMMDCTFFSIQKGFGLPAGLCVVMLSGRAVQTSEEIYARGHYNGLFHSFASLAKQARENRTLETPNVLFMFLLNDVVNDFLARTVATIRHEMHEKKALLYASIEKNPELTIAVENPQYRSDSVIVALTSNGSSPIITKLKESGFLIAPGYHTDKELKIRIANFPQHTITDVRALAALL